MLPRMRGRTCAVLVLGICAALAACKVHRSKRGLRIGTGCDSIDESCTNATTAKMCRDGVPAEVACKGPKGCVDAPPEDVACDQSVAEERDACTGASAYACSPAKDALLKCERGRFEKSSACPSHVCSVTVTVSSFAGGGTMKSTIPDCR